MIRPGAHLTFDSINQIKLIDQWESSRIEPSLRMLVLTAALIYHEQGSSRVTVLKLLGNSVEELERKDGPHYYGCAADISIRELIDARYHDKSIMISKRFPKANFVVRRLNSLFPFGQGSKVSALYNVNHIHLEVPMGGYKKETQALATWMENGSVGNPRPYHRMDIRGEAV